MRRFAHALIALMIGATACKKSTPAPAPAASELSMPAAGPVASASAHPPDTAAPDSDAAVKPAPQVPRTKLQAVAQQAVSREEFEKLVDESAWAVYDPGATGCPIAGETVRLDKPADAVLEFDRQKHRSALVDRLVVVNGDVESVKPEEGSSSTLSLYDHALGVFTVALRFTDSKWPATGGSPTIRADRELSSVEDVFVADRGGGYVITAPQRVPFYVFGSVATFKVKADAETAKRWTQDGVALRYVIVQRFKKLVFHKDCRKVCKRVDKDTVDCPDDPENQGLGQYYVTEPIGYEVYLDGKLIAEKQPPDGLVAAPVPEASPTSVGAPASVAPDAKPRAPTQTPASAPTPGPAKPNRAKCLGACISACGNDANCERSCAVQKCK